MKRNTTTTIINLLAFSLLSSSAQAIVTSTSTATSTISQLTDFASSNQMDFDSRDPDISKDGSKAVFISTADLIPGGNPDNIANLYLMNSDGTDLRQLTSATLDSTHLTNIPYYTSAPRLSADGSVVVFASTNNLTGENAPILLNDPNFPGSSYYIPNYQIFIINSDGTGLKQLTKGYDGDAKFPRISADGSIIAFQSTQDLVGSNSDGTEEIYVIKADGTDLTQITKGDPKPENGANVRSDASRNVSISGDGTTVAFDSFADLIPPQNDDFSDEIFVFDLAGYWQDGATTADLPSYTIQVTDTDIDAEFHLRAEDSFEPSLSFDGKTIAFSACINPKGEGIGDPNRTILGDNPYLPDVIFYAEVDAPNRTSGEIVQLTFSDNPEAYADDPNWNNIDDDAHWPEISDDGRRIVFGTRSRVDIINDGNEYEIAMIDLDAPLGPDGAPVVEQLTYNTSTTGPYVLQLTFDGTDGARLRPSISANASKIVMRADSNFTTGNPDGNSEIFMIEPNYIRATSNQATDPNAPTEQVNNSVDNNQPESTSEVTNNNDEGGVASFGFTELLLVLLCLGGLKRRR